MALWMLSCDWDLWATDCKLVSRPEAPLWVVPLESTKRGVMWFECYTHRIWLLVSPLLPGRPSDPWKPTRHSGLSPLDLSAASITAVYLSFHMMPVASWHHALLSSFLSEGSLLRSLFLLIRRSDAQGFFRPLPSSLVLLGNPMCPWIHLHAWWIPAFSFSSNSTQPVVPLWYLRVPNMPKIAVSSPKKPFPLPLLTPPSAPWNKPLVILDDFLFPLPHLQSITTSDCSSNKEYLWKVPFSPSDWPLPWSLF